MERSDEKQNLITLNCRLAGVIIVPDRRYTDSLATSLLKQRSKQGKNHGRPRKICGNLWNIENNVQNEPMGTRLGPSAGKHVGIGDGFVCDWLRK